MSDTIFAKVIMTVQFQALHYADSLREEASKIEFEPGDNYETVENKLDEIMRLRGRANELEREALPSTKDLFLFLRTCDYGTIKPRFVEMIDDVNGFRPYYSQVIYIENGFVKISFVTKLDSSYQSLEEMEYCINEEPFFKSRTGGHVGNYCKYPSRVDPEDQLGELEMSADVFRTTDETGKHFWEDPALGWERQEEEEPEDSDTEEDEVKHPFYMTHEQLFGEPREMDLDEVYATKVLGLKPKQKWSKRFIPKPIRALFKRVH